MTLDGAAEAYGPFDFTVGTEPAPTVRNSTMVAVSRMSQTCNELVGPADSCAELRHRQRACELDAAILWLRFEIEKSPNVALYEVRSRASDDGYALPPDCGFELPITGYDPQNLCAEQHCFEVTVYDRRGVSVFTEHVCEDFNSPRRI